MSASYRVSTLSNKRVNLVAVFFLLALFVIIIKLFYIQVIRNKHYVEAAQKQQWALDTIPAKRGYIYVEDKGTKELYTLATNMSLDMVFVVPKDLENKEETASKLSEALKKDKEEISTAFSKSVMYAPIKRRLTQEESKSIKELKIKGVHLKKEEWRFYPENALASQLLGYVNDEGDGQYGIEEFLNNDLKGVAGVYKAESDTLGRKIAFGRDISKPSKDGKSVVLTINRDIQFEAERILSEGVKKFGAEGGSLIVMDPNTGKILAMSNNPTFNPNEYKNEKNYSSFKNKAVLDTYEPGSIMKVITMAAGLDANKVEPDTKYTDTGSVILSGNKIMNSTKKTYGERDMSFVLAESLNTGMVFILGKLGKSSFFEYLKKFGFGERTGIEIGSEGEGEVIWNSDKEHTVATMSFGQSISATPLQMISSFSTIANGGVMMRPSLIAKTIDRDGKEQVTKPEEVRQVISENAATKLSTMLVNVVEKGHGYQAKIKGYKVAGKTGTAQVPRKDGLGYETDKNIGSFVGFAPAFTPEFVVMAKVDYPKGVQWAESTAAPMVGEMLDFLLKYYQIPPTEMKEIGQ